MTHLELQPHHPGGTKELNAWQSNESMYQNLMCITGFLYGEAATPAASPYREPVIQEGLLWGLHLHTDYREWFNHNHDTPLLKIQMVSVEYIHSE